MDTGHLYPLPKANMVIFTTCVHKYLTESTDPVADVNCKFKLHQKFISEPEIPELAPHSH